MGERVQIPAYSDRWMMGDRYGEIVSFGSIPWEKIDEAIRPRGYRPGEKVETAKVKLDKSGKTVAFILNDCTPV